MKNKTWEEAKKDMLDSIDYQVNDLDNNYANVMIFEEHIDSFIKMLKEEGGDGKYEKLMKVIELIDNPSENIISEEEWLKNGKLANRFK